MYVAAVCKALLARNPDDEAVLIAALRIARALSGITKALSRHRPPRARSHGLVRCPSIARIQTGMPQ